MSSKRRTKAITAIAAIGLWALMPASAAAAAPAVAGTPGTEPAPPPKRESRWHLGLEANTDFPIAISGRINLEMPLRFRFATSLGVMPGPYVDAINAVVVAAGGYDQATADLIAGALKNALVWRAQFGWRFHPRWGFYLDAGYSLAALGGGATGSDIIKAAGYPCTACPLGQQIPVHSILHLFVAELGYEWVLFRHFTLRSALGFAGTMAASTKVESPISKFNVAVADYLNSQYKGYGFAPTITFGAGGRFF